MIFFHNNFCDFQKKNWHMHRYKHTYTGIQPCSQIEINMYTHLHPKESVHMDVNQ